MKKMVKPCRDCPFTKSLPLEEFSEVLILDDFACHETLGLDEEKDCKGRLLLIQHQEQK